MAQFNFYGTTKDSHQAVETVLASAKITAIPNLTYSKKAPLYFSQMNAALKKCLRETGILFLRGSFSSSPIQFNRIEAGAYAVNVTTSGFIIEMAVPRSEVTEGQFLLLRPGSVSHRSVFWDAKIATSYRASSELNSVYKTIRNNLKATLVEAKIGKRSVWMGHDAFAKLQDGSAKLLSLGRWWTVREGIPQIDNRKGF